VIVDLPRAEATTKSLGQLADYVAMLALTEPRDLRQCNVLPSVTDLFAACPDRPAPDGLTTADAAYLAALYPAASGVAYSTGTEAAVAQRMAGILGGAKVASR
jgi:hypothetical protein